MSGSAQVTIETVSKIFEKSLTIPEYQRPYKWQTKHVKQLVDDIHSYFKKQDDKADDKADDNAKCRLGTIVLHHHKDDKDVGKYDIVDGQQRLTSLFLLLYVLSNKENPFNNKFLEQEFNHTQSMVNIRKNHQFLQSFIKELGDEKYRADFKAYILQNCDFAVVVLDNLDEAFQYFDSQNSRGKSLEAYDLLKAYHLREMADADKYTINSVVETWEQAITHPISLKLIINDILYRYREWEWFRSAEHFDKQKVDVFKGISPKDKGGYVQILLRYLNNPAMNMPMVDGIGFFDYISRYRQLYGKLFNAGGLVNNDKIVLPANDEQSEPLYQVLQGQTGRSGDFYLFTLFRIMTMAYYDKFGDYEFERAVRKIAQWVYRLRLEKERISFATIENYAMKDVGLVFSDGEYQQMSSLYNVIRCANMPSEVLDFQVKKVEVKFQNAEYAKKIVLSDLLIKKGENP